MFMSGSAHAPVWHERVCAHVQCQYPGAPWRARCQ
jgi:hypothetical protein